MPAIRLLVRLLLYYAALAGVVWVGLWMIPNLESYLPIGRVQALIAQADGAQPVTPNTTNGLTAQVANTNVASPAYSGTRINHMASFGGQPGLAGRGGGGVVAGVAAGQLGLHEDPQPGRL